MSTFVEKVEKYGDVSLHNNSLPDQPAFMQTRVRTYKLCQDNKASVYKVYKYITILPWKTIFEAPSKMRSNLKEFSKLLEEDTVSFNS